jgi:L-gulonate 3-dehydrogenase
VSKIAIIGAGLVGRGWSIVFARAGHEVALYDSQAAALDSAPRQISQTLTDLHRNGIVDEAAETIAARVQATGDLIDALSGAVYVQENVPETVAAKKAIFAKLDETAAPETILASSTSGIAASRFTEELAHRERCLVSHPINPPSLIPLVEIVPAPWTDAAVVERTRELLAGAGQIPIVLEREIAGFIVNRLQAALLNEAFALIEDGYVNSDDLDKAIKHGLGARWSFMGPMETIDLNAPGGIRDYMKRYGPLYHEIAQQARPRGYSDALIDRVEKERRTALRVDQREERMAWRDSMLMRRAAANRK